MSNQPDKPFGQGIAVVSLVAALGCAFASNAVASQAPAQPAIGDQNLSARVATLVERIRLVDPALLRDLPGDRNIAHFGN